MGNLFAHATAPARTALRLGAETAPRELREILLAEPKATMAGLTARTSKPAKRANPLRIVPDGESGPDYLFGTGRYARRKPARPQLILLYPRLPRMSGSEFLQRVRGDERTRDLPVVVLTVSP